MLVEESFPASRIKDTACNRPGVAAHSASTPPRSRKSQPTTKSLDVHSAASLSRAKRAAQSAGKRDVATTVAPQRRSESETRKPILTRAPVTSACVQKMAFD